MALELLGLAAFGLMTGVLSGVLGVGGGIFMVPLLVVALGLTQQEAQATSLVVVLVTAIVATWSLQRRGVGDLRASTQIGLVGAASSVGGTFLALSLPGHVLRIVFAILLFLVGSRLLYDANHGRKDPDAVPR